MIEIRNLTKKIGSTVILDGISFFARKGEILGFLGPNGAGKSTTMKIATTYWHPTSGQITVDGMDIASDPLGARKKIGYLPEHVPLYEDMRVCDYLRFVAEARGLQADILEKRLKEVVENCGLSKVVRRPIDELSKGYRQRVGLAQAIMHDPEILILDEPTTGLDPNQIIEIRDLIKKLGREKTVVFSTHILSEVSAVCDRVIIINNGKIVGEGTADELKAKSASSRDVLYLKIRGRSEDALEKIKTIEGVFSIIIKDKEAEDIIGYDIEIEPGRDLREAVSTTVFNSGWPVIELTRKSVSLEDVFRELTK